MNFEPAIVGTLLETPKLNGDCPNLEKLLADHAAFDDRRAAQTVEVIKSLQDEGKTEREQAPVTTSLLAGSSHLVERAAMLASKSFPVNSRVIIWEDELPTSASFPDGKVYPRPMK